MGDSWRFDPNKDYLNDEDDNGRGFRKFKHKKNKNRNNSYDYEENYDRKPRHKNYSNKKWR